jgi:uncharacterized membrane protein
MATTILATAGVVFSLLTLPLSTVAAQYGSRLLRVFLGDRTTQIVLGMFVSTFVYCLFAALSIPPVEVQPEGPQVTVTMGLWLMLATFASLILLIQHISTMLQAPNIVAAAGTELLDVIHAETPPAVGRGGEASQPCISSADTLLEKDGYTIKANDTGYIQFMDPEYMLILAREEDLCIRLLSKPGHFVRPGTVVALVWPTTQIDERLVRQIRRAFQVGNQRTPTQDTEYAVNQLVEVAVRAMSPAINDPFTAMTCLDQIGAGLVQFIKRGEVSPNFSDQDGKLRLVYEPVTFDELLNAAFDMLRHASCDNASVLLRMLETIDAISQETGSPESRQELLRHAGLILAESQAGALVEGDRQVIRLRCESLRTKLEVAL